MVRRKSVSGSDPLAGLRVYEDEDLLVVNKPRGMLTSSGPRDRRPTLWGTVQAYGDQTRQQVGLIHRLDRDASGLLVFSKNDRAYQSLKKQFFRHTVERQYMTVVQGRPKHASGRIRSWLSEWKNGTVHTTVRRDKGEEAVSDFEVISYEPGYCLVRVTLETGRKHQIRVHMASLGTPIAGDEVYNPKARQEGMMLVAKRLCFDHPRTGERMEFEVDLPPHMRDFVRWIRSGEPAPKPEPMGYEAQRPARRGTGRQTQQKRGRTGGGRTPTRGRGKSPGGGKGGRGRAG